jgi:hypothetical protein
MGMEIILGVWYQNKRRYDGLVMNPPVVLLPFLNIRSALILCTGVILAGMFGMMLYMTHGTFIYIQDDPYIHLQIARNLVMNGTWGITPGTFASASSSPLWVFLLAIGYLLIGNATLYFPLIINVVAVFAIVLLMLRILKSFAVIGMRALFIIAFVAFVTPLGPFAFGGMEHPLHMIAVLLFTYFLAKVLGSLDARKSDQLFLLSMAPLVTALRYEGVFVIVISCLLLLLKRRYGLMVLVGVLGALPLAVFGLWSMSQGGYFVPNTLLIKKNLSLSLLSSIKGMASAAYLNIKTPIFMLFSAEILMTLYYRIRKDCSFWRRETVALALIGGAFVLQSVFGKLSWVAMFRYEAYLVLAGLLFMFICLRDVPLRSLYSPKFFSWMNVVLLSLLILLSLPFLRRAISWPYAILNARDLYNVSYQDARFFNSEYPNSAIGTIDIGMVSYFGQPYGVRVIDFWGLANTEIATARAHGTYNSDTMRTIASQENVQVAELFDSWLSGIMPTEWIKVATWSIEHNVSIGSNVISFYAPTCAGAITLGKRMREFAPMLPQTTRVTFLNLATSTACASTKK